MLEELTTFDELHDEVDSILILKDIVAIDKEWMAILEENFFL